MNNQQRVYYWGKNRHQKPIQALARALGKRFIICDGAQDIPALGSGEKNMHEQDMLINDDMMVDNRYTDMIKEFFIRSASEGWTVVFIGHKLTGKEGISLLMRDQASHIFLGDVKVREAVHAMRELYDDDDRLTPKMCGTMFKHSRDYYINNPDPNNPDNTIGFLLIDKINGRKNPNFLFRCNWGGTWIIDPERDAKTRRKE